MGNVALPRLVQASGASAWASPYAIWLATTRDRRLPKSSKSRIRLAEWAGVSLFELFLPVLEVLKSLPPPLNHEKRRHGYFIGTQREAGRLLNHEQCRRGSLLEEPY